MPPKYRAIIKKQRRARKPGRKRKVTACDEAAPMPSCSSSSEKKLKMNEPASIFTKSFFTWFYILIDSRIFRDIIDIIGICPDCKENIEYDINIDEKKGLSQSLKFSCYSCGWYKSFWTSREVKTKERGRKRFDINTRIIIAFREIGKAFASILTFCGFMNIPPPMTRKSFQDIQNSYVIPAYKDAAEKNMNDSASEVRGGTNDVTNTKISTDGTWQRRGFSSLNGQKNKNKKSNIVFI